MRKLFARIARWIPPWSILHRLGRSRVLKTSYIWFVVVPIAAKATQWRMDIGEYVFRPVVSLPFSWKVFFFSALCVAVANAIYQFFCPPLVREYQTYSEFLNQGKGDRQLGEYLLTTAFSGRPIFRVAPRQTSAVREFLDFAQNPRDVWQSIANEGSRTDIARALTRVRINDDDLGDAFWHVRSFSDGTHPHLRFICALFYGIGFALLAWVMAENILFVVRIGFGILTI